MRQSQIFTKTRKEAPKDEVSKSAGLLIRGGFIHKELAGVYAMLPLGFRVMKKIENIIREEMNALGASEISMTAIQNPELWKKTDRWDDDKYDIWFKTPLKNGTEVGLATTHEEPLTNLMTEHIHSYKDLPKYTYQFQTKFRNELRAKSGIMRGREFLMKDLYSFSTDKNSHDDFYEKAKQAYVNIFERVGIGSKTFLTFSSGGTFSKFSHEFQTETDAGEDIVYYSEDKKIAVNKEVYTDEVLADLGIDKNKLIEKKTVEVGNIFTLGTRFSEPLELFYDDEEGNKKPVFMGSYGIGLGRLMGVIAEILSDEKGLVWPKSVAPFEVHLIALDTEGEVREKADQIYEKLTAEGIEVLYDDRDVRAGEKFGDADLIGIPKQIIIGKNSLKEGKVEVKDRASGEIETKSF